MPLATGTRFGPYEILAPLGKGGMGEVFRARDTRLNREVALKVLPAEFAQHAWRRERFEREAKAVAALNHPNIVGLYDIGEEQGQVFIISELVEGETLRSAALPYRKAIDLAAQIAEGLAAAHAAGVTHRDIKPDNVMITAEGRAKILDFGLAKITRKASNTSADPDATETAAQSLTQAGTVMGTAGYMSPEQVRGEESDHRSDIFSFGALLHEMLSGARAFKGATSIETMAAILHAEPPDLPDTIPPGVRDLVGHCLAKNPDQRFQSAKDLAYALRAAGGRPATITESQSVLTTTPPRSRRSVPIAVIAAALVVGALAGGISAARWATSQDNTPEPIHLSRFASERAEETEPAFSPDGRSIAYSRILGDVSELVVQSVVENMAGNNVALPVVLASAPSQFRSPVWTPDGTRICYSQVGGFWCVGASGGTPQRLLAQAGVAVFTPDGKSLLFVREDAGNAQLFASSPPGAEPKRVEGFQLPTDASSIAGISRDGGKLLLGGTRGAGGRSGTTLWVAPYPAGPVKALPVEGGVQSSNAHWLPDNRHIVYVNLNVSGLEFRIIVRDTDTGARRLLLADTGAIISSGLSPDGHRLVYSTGQPEWDIVEYNMDGKRVRPMVASSLMDVNPNWSPSGDRFSYGVGGTGREGASWTRAADGSSPQPISALWGSGIVYSPDGRRFASITTDGGIATLPVAGGRPVLIYPNRVNGRVCWSPDGEWIWFAEREALRKVPSQGGTAVTVKDKMGLLRLLNCSPDGRLAYSNERGVGLVTPDGKQDRLLPKASPFNGAGQFGEGGRVFYTRRFARGNDLDVIDVETGAVRRTVHFDLDPSDSINGYAVHPDGKRVLLVIGGLRYDLWMAEGFAQPATGWRSWFRHWQFPQPPASTDPNVAK
ncbi:MAG: protein kinase [Acidobacteriota bacterium]